MLPTGKGYRVSGVQTFTLMLRVGHAAIKGLHLGPEEETGLSKNCMLVANPVLHGVLKGQRARYILHSEIGRCEMR